MQVLWTHAARQDLIDIGDYIALRSPDAAARFVGELLDRMALCMPGRSGCRRGRGVVSDF